MKKAGLLFLVAMMGFPGAARTESDVAVLIMAPGGSSAWNKAVKKAVHDAKLTYPSRLFFGMGDTQANVRDLQDDVAALEGEGAHTIVVVPLLVSSYSEVARQWKFLLGVDVQPGFINNPSFPIERHSTINFSEPLNDSSAVVEILLDRAQEISERPANEAVVIVAHGPNDNSDNQHWGEILQRIADGIRRRGGFKSVEGISLRDDAPAAIRSQSVQALRARIEAINRAGDRALVVPLALAPGGMENKVGLELRGMAYAFNTKTLLPDSRISEWIRSQVP
jgi:sirohydrochlorin cobaltochelatase